MLRSRQRGCPFTAFGLAALVQVRCAIPSAPLPLPNSFLSSPWWATHQEHCKVQEVLVSLCQDGLLRSHRCPPAESSLKGTSPAGPSGGTH